MARKRGGLAGIWDRNKGIIKAVAPVALGMIPGVGVPLAAAAGAAMGGLDRPGKGGIGLDVGGALKGGVTGYLGGQTGKGIAGGVRNLLAPKAPDISGTLAKTSGMLDEANAQILSKPAFGGAPTNFVQVTGGGMPAAEIDAMRQSARAAAGRMGNIPRPMSTAPQLTMSQAAAPPSMITDVASGVADAARSARMPFSSGGGDGDKIRKLLAGGRNFMRENKDIIEMVGKYTMPPRESAIDRMKAETDRRQQEAQQRFYEFQMQQTRDAEARDLERRRAVLQFLSPYIRQNAPLLNPSAFGMEG